MCTGTTVRAHEASRVKARIRLVGVLVACVAGAADPARGQYLPPPPDATEARLHAGPFRLNPSIALTNVGVDTNLFNEADIADPRRDVAFTFSPQTDFATRLGRTWLMGNVRQDLVWFREYSDQRSANGTYRAGWYVPLTRVTWLVEGSLLHSKERPGFEIDLRARRLERGATAMGELRAGARTFVGGRIDRREVRFEEHQSFAGRSLSHELDRLRTAGAVTVRHELTPLTSVSIEASAFEDRFTHAVERSTRSTQLAGGVRFDPSALVKGHALIGYRSLSSRSAVIPDFHGPTVSASLSFIAGASTRLSVDGVRDIEYSFDPARPYYLMSGLAASVTQRIFGPVDVQARVAWRSLAYRDRTDLTPDVINRRDRVTTFAESIGYRLGRSTRLAFDVETQRRHSPLLLRSYHGNRYGLSLIWTP